MKKGKEFIRALSKKKKASNSQICLNSFSEDCGKSNCYFSPSFVCLSAPVLTVRKRFNRYCLLLYYVGPNVTCDMYFYAEKSRCTNSRYWNFFKPKFKGQLADALGIKANRLKITGCTPGSIIVHFYILDVVGEKRNVHVQRDLDDLILKQTFKVIMNNGDDFWMYDLNQTTPKPPPPTIPPIGEVTVDWLPIGLAIGSLSALITSKFFCFPTL